MKMKLLPFVCYKLQVKLHYIIRFEFDIRLEFVFDSKLEIFVHIRFELKKAHSHTSNFHYAVRKYSNENT